MSCEVNESKSVDLTLFQRLEMIMKRVKTDSAGEGSKVSHLTTCQHRY